MDSRPHLRCLGQPALFAPTGEPIRLKVKKHLGLLVYLAVDAGRPQRRDWLAEFLWPKADPAEARHSLSTALSTLRLRLGRDALETGRDHIRLQAGRLALDLDRLLAGDILGNELTGPLEVTGFLDGFDLVDSVEFTHWKDRQQARLLPAIKEALVTLMDRSRRSGDFREIERLADRMLALDDLSEEAIRAKMEARAFAGDRLTGLRLFEEWKAKLAAELHAAPSELVEGMALRLRRRGWEQTTARDIPTVPTDQWRDRVFIGRTAEYRALYEAWESSREGASGHVLVLGDSGVGKTTLVERLATAAGLEGAVVSRAQCHDLEREIPYSAVSTLIRSLLDRPGVSGTSPEALAELARTVPEIRQRFPTIPPSGDSEGETARIRLTEAFLGILLAIGEEHPIILVVDDLHLADDASLAVLHLVMRRAHGKPIMMMFIARLGELRHSPQATRLRERAPTLGMRELTLEPLTEEESAQLLSSLVAGDQRAPSLMFRRALIRAAAGHPMIMELLLQDWRERGDQSLTLSVSAMTPELRSSSAPAAYQAILERLVLSLETTTRNVLNLAAILGPRLSDLEMYILADLSIGQTMTGMSELVRRRVLRDDGDGLEFVNELLRGAAYLAVPSPLRKALHSGIADRLIEQHQCGNTREIGLQIAWHCLRGGRKQEATTFLLQGVRETIHCGALHTAEYSLTTALPDLTGDDRRDALLLLIEVLHDQDRWIDSLNFLRDSALDCVPDLARTLSLCAEAHIGCPSVDDSLEQLSELVSIIESATTPKLRVKAARSATRIVCDLRSEEIAREMLHHVNKIPLDQLPEESLAELAVARSLLHYRAQERDDHLRTTTEILRHLEQRGAITKPFANLVAGLGSIRFQEGNYVEARKHTQRAYDISVRLGNDHRAGTYAADVALCAGRLGDYHEQLAWSKKALLTFGPTFSGYVEVQAAHYSAFASIFLGDSDAAAAAMSRVDQRIPSFVPPWLAQAWQLCKADIFYLLGQQSTAMAVARAAVEYPKPILHTLSFAGHFARWFALTQGTAYEQRLAEEHIGRLVVMLPNLDAIDQAEVLCADLLVRSGTLSPAVLQRQKSLLTEKLNALPPAVTQQLRSLGVLHS